MSVKLSNIYIEDNELLRKLLLVSLDSIFDSFQVLDKEAPLAGNPILLLTPDQQINIISFDVHTQENALLNGIEATEKLLVDIPLFKRIYPELRSITNNDIQVRLVLLHHAASIINSAACFFNNNINIYSYRPIGINGEAALLIEPTATTIITTKFTTNDAATSIVKSSVPGKSGVTESFNRNMNNEPDEVSEELSAEEHFFFQQL